MTDLPDRFSGALLGLAAGDALGTALEFKAPGTFRPISDMVGGGTFNLKAGQWTDDTSMALCLAESLIERHGFDPVDQLERYWRWYQEGYLSSTGACFDIGNTTAQSLQKFHRERQPYSGPTAPQTAGNGSLMRLAPVPMACYRNPQQAIRYSADSSRTTHGAPAAVDACRYFAGLLIGAFNNVHKSELLRARFTPVANSWTENPLHPEIDAIAAGSFRQKMPPQIRGSGYVVHTLEAVLWAFEKTETFRDGALLVVNLGEDADTTGAVYGQLAGAYYGAAAIPEAWRNKLTMKDYIHEQAMHLYTLAQTLY